MWVRKERVEQKRTPWNASKCFLLSWLLVPECSYKTGKSFQLWGISFQSLAIMMTWGFSVLQAAPWSVLMASVFVTCFLLFCLQTFSLRYFIFPISQFYGSINTCPKLQYEQVSCPISKKFLFCCQGLISSTVVLLCLPHSLSWTFKIGGFVGFQFLWFGFGLFFVSLQITACCFAISEIERLTQKP